MMRTTVRLDEDLLSEVKRLAAEERTTLTAMLEKALREMLARRKQQPPSAGGDCSRGLISTTHRLSST
jgi:predicted transcriptional regulator